MKSYKITSAVVACMIGIAVQQASANTIGTVTLGTMNIPGYTGPYATATAQIITPTTANFTFTGLNSPVGGFIFGIGDVAINVNAASGFVLSNVKENGVAINDGPFGSGNEDGFGAFNAIVNTSNTGSSSYLKTVSFTLTLATANWTDVTQILALNNKNNFIAAHVYVFDSNTNAVNNTGFITQSPGLTVVTFNVDSVPDGGSTVLLLGAALSGLGMLARRVKK